MNTMTNTTTNKTQNEQIRKLSMTRTLESTDNVHTSSSDYNLWCSIPGVWGSSVRVTFCIESEFEVEETQSLLPKAKIEKDVAFLFFLFLIRFLAYPWHFLWLASGRQPGTCSENSYGNSYTHIWILKRGVQGELPLPGPCIQICV